MRTCASSVRYGTILYPAINESRKSASIAFIASALYGLLSYYEFLYLSEILSDWHAYRRVFALFAGNPEDEGTCSINQMLSTVQEKDLSTSLSKGQMALVKFIGIKFFKPLVLEASKQALTFSLRSSLIRKWLSGRNYQLGLKIVDYETAVETREIIHDYSTQFIEGLVERTSSFVDVIVAAGKVYNIYTVGLVLSAQGLTFNLLGFTALAFGLYFTTNMILNLVSKNYSESMLKSQVTFKNNLTFNMDNALQVECSQATAYESQSLGNLLVNMTTIGVKQSIISNGINTISMVFTNFLHFAVLGYSIPAIVKNPGLYFEMEKVGDLIVQLGVNMWDIFWKISNTNNMHYASTRIARFIDSIDRYKSILTARRDFQLDENAKSNLFVDLTIKYPTENKGVKGDKVLVKDFKKKFIPGNVYAICGRSGSGKTSFFNSLVGVNPYTSGRVTIARKEDIVYVPQKPVFKLGLDWMETILYPLDRSVYDRLRYRSNLDELILEWTNTLGLGEVYNKVPRTEKDMRGRDNWTGKLSGGEAQRVSIIQALARVYICRQRSKDNKVVLLLDESLNALDPKRQEVAFKLLKSEVKKFNVTALHIDHSDERILEARYGEKFIIDFNELRVEDSLEKEGKEMR